MIAHSRWPAAVWGTGGAEESKLQKKVSGLGLGEGLTGSSASNFQLNGGNAAGWKKLIQLRIQSVTIVVTPFGGDAGESKRGLKCFREEAEKEGGGSVQPVLDPLEQFHFNGEELANGGI
jgi:hypothetical protein